MKYELIDDKVYRKEEVSLRALRDRLEMLKQQKADVQGAIDEAKAEIAEVKRDTGVDAEAITE